MIMETWVQVMEAISRTKSHIQTPVCVNRSIQADVRHLLDQLVLLHVLVSEVPKADQVIAHFLSRESMISDKSKYKV